MHIDLMQLEFIDLNLRKMGVELQEETGLVLTVTSLYRMGDKGVHGQLPLRGIDYRVRSQEMGELLAKMVNAKWQYDPKRPRMKCAVAHGRGRAYHLHTQTHPRTVRKK